MKYLRNMSIAKRIAVAFGLALLILVGQSVMGYLIAGTSQSLLQTTVFSARLRYELALNVRDAIQSEELHLRRMAVLVDRDPIDQEAEFAIKSGDSVKSTLEKLTKQVLSKSDMSIVDELTRLQNLSIPIRESIIDLSKKMQTDQANAIFDQQLDPLSIQRRALAARLSDAQRALVDDSFQSMLALAGQTRSAVVVSAAIGVLVASIAGVYLYRSISRPINAAVKVSDHIASGDLTLEIDSNENNEIGNMMRAMGAMSRKMCAVITEIGEASSSIHIASSEIASGNLDLSQRTERQAVALEVATQSIEEIASSVNHSADASRGAQMQAQDAAAIATQGGIRVSRLVKTMEDISKSSQRISEIVGVIDGIAFQTNILALNAAVEAARAGEQGRGFAVVASEVRTLAKRSAQAAKEIKELIQANVHTVSSGVEQVGDAGSTMKSIVISSEKVATAMTEISTASDKQAVSIGQVHVAVAEIDEGIRQNAALVEEASAAAESLKTQTENLNHAIAQFKVTRSPIDTYALLRPLPWPTA